MSKSTEVKFLLIANTFAPINGGSAVVYDNICRFAPPNTAFVLTAWNDYTTGKAVEGWQDFDIKANYVIYRLPFLRLALSNTKKSLLENLWVMIFQEIPLKIKVILKVIEIVKQNNISVICIGELVSVSWIGRFCQYFLGCKTINYIHGEEITTVTPWRFYGKNRKSDLKRADAVVAVSEFTKQSLIDLMDVDPNKITLIVNAINISKFSPGAKNISIIKRYNLDSKKIILSVGRLVERKGFDMAIKALPQVLKVCPNVHYLIIGEGEFKPKLDRIIEDLNLESHITFLGKVGENELIQFYQTSDIFIMPNRELADHDTEGFGLVFLEANACGKAVIGGRAGGVVDAIKDGENGLLVDGNNLLSISKSIIRLLTDDVLRKTLEKRGLQIAQATSAEVCADRFYSLCLNLTKNK